MKRWLAGVVSVIAIVMVAVAPAASASTQDFSFSKFEADYYLSRDNSGRSSMQVNEQLVAEFPPYDQNKGIIRAIPLSYDGHSVSLVFNDASLTRNGAKELVYDKQRSNGNLEVSTGTDDYVRGTQVYSYSYNLRDVTKDFGDHQELYWDTNGTEWLQSFGVVIAHVHVDASIASALTDETACYQGAAGISESCNITSTQDEQGDTVISFQSTRRLGVRENLTFVIGFKADAFQPYQMGAQEYIALALRFLMIVMALGAVVWAIILKLTKGRNAKGRGTIVPEYLPPKGVSVLVASELSGTNLGKDFAAQIIDLAVRHNVQIIEYEKSNFIFGKKKAYRLRFVSDTGLNQDESRFVSLLFDPLVPDAEYDMGDQSKTVTVGMALSVYGQSLKRQMVEKGYRRKLPGRFLPIVLGIVASILAVFIVSMFQGSSSFDILSFFMFATAIPSTGVAVILLGGSLPLTEQGAEIRDYVKGLKMYIKVAEAERLKILQSVKGAARQEVGNVQDHGQLVKLYERVLPYAILFGLEKSWGKVLEQYYQDQAAPTWYVGSGAFNIASFTSSLSSFAASTSSSSSGLGGGGSSGGGGGGGGGGGR